MAAGFFAAVQIDHFAPAGEHDAAGNTHGLSP